MKFRHYIFIITMILVLSNLTASAVTHFTFRVPVSIDNKNNCINSIKVEVYVSSKIPISARENDVIGRGEKTVSMSGRSTLKTTVVVRFNAKSNKFPSNAKSWMATLKVRKTGKTGYVNASPASFRTDDPGTTCVIDLAKPKRSWDEGRFTP